MAAQDIIDKRVKTFMTSSATPPPPKNELVLNNTKTKMGKVQLPPLEDRKQIEPIANVPSNTPEDNARTARGSFDPRVPLPCIVICSSPSKNGN
jgi:hypothetical protein